MKTKLLLFIVFSLVFYHSNAQQTFVPDDAFEYALIQQGYDNVLDDYVTTANISGITTLSIYEKNIADLTGIEDFTALEELNCWNNQLTSLDLSQNTNLKVLNGWGNQLTSLNISQNVLLEVLDVSHNQLTNLDVSQNTALTGLICLDNQLTTLNVTQNINLLGLNCGSNQLTALDVSQNTLLESIECGNNQISSLDVSQCTLLETLMADNNTLVNLDLTQNVNINVIWIRNNQLTQVDVRNGNNTAINGFWVMNNPNLTCIFVEDVNYSLNNPGWDKDPTATYVETQAECDALAGINDLFIQQIKIYPNPVRNKLFINSESARPVGGFRILNSEVTIRNILGKKVYHVFLSGQSSQFDLSHLSQGIYFLNIYKNKTRLLTQKLIKL